MTTIKIKQRDMRFLTDFLHTTFNGHNGGGITFGVCALIAWFGHLVLAFSSISTWEYVLKALMGLMAIFAGGIVGEIGKRVGSHIIRNNFFINKKKKDDERKSA